MYNSILVPVDGSRLSETALSVAVPLARHHGATLHVVTVQPLVPTIVGAGGAPVADTTFDRELRRAATEHLRQIRDRLAEEAGDVPVESEQLEGRVAETLAERIDERGHDLVVMTTHGHRGVSRLWLGSVADALIRMSPAPVLLVTDPTKGDRTDAAFPFANVLLPVTADENISDVLTHALALAGPTATYHLFTVVEPLPFVPRSPLDLMTATDESGTETHAPRSEFEQAVAHLESLASDLRNRGLAVRTSVAIHRHPAEAILVSANELASPLIAMATRGYGAARRLLIGSVTDKVVRAASVPVLVRTPVEG